MIEFMYAVFWVAFAIIYSCVWIRAYKAHQHANEGVENHIFPISMLVWAHTAFLVIQPYFFAGVVATFIGHSCRKESNKKAEPLRGSDVWWSYDYYAEKFQNINGVIVEWPVQLIGTQVVGARGGSMRERK